MSATPPSSTFDVFLTAYDPSDLPGFSIDPLGFDRAYEFLAEKLLPALTNVANTPRYFSMICAGVYLADVNDDAPRRQQVERRRNAVLRLERLWGLANVLATEGQDVSLSGLRGVRYINAEVARLREAGAKYANLDYRLLSRQAPNGALGIYGAVAEELRLIDRENYVLAPDSGERLAEAFIDGTSMPTAIKKATAGGDEKVGLDALATWGAKAGLLATVTDGEVPVFRDAVLRDPLRARTCQQLIAHPASEYGGELERMAAVHQTLVKSGQEPDIADALSVISAMEALYRPVILALERLIWLCRTASPPLGDSQATGDSIFNAARAASLEAAPRFHEALAKQRTLHIGKAPEALADICKLADLVQQTKTAREFLDVIVERHRQVQTGKFDRGRRKAPWIERVTGGLALTSSHVGGLPFEATELGDIRPHAYRFATADALVAAARLA